MVPSEGFCLENGDDNGREHDKRYGFLYDFQQDKVERASIDRGTDSIGGNHEEILNQCNAP